MQPRAHHTERRGLRKMMSTRLDDVPGVGVVGLLDNGGALPPVPDLAPQAERLDLQVLVPRPGEHAAGALQEISALRVIVG